MKKTAFRDSVRIFALLGCLFLGLSVSQASAAASSEELCDSGLSQRLTDALKAKAAFRNDALRQDFTAPASIEQVANTPCVSKELDKVVSKFSGAPSTMIGQLTGGGGGPIGSIMNKFFRSGFKSLSNAAQFVPQMLNFQGQASGVLGDLLGGLGGGDAFSDELCGMMVDMLVKFVQCQVPLELPQLSSLTGSLNNLLPQGCAGNAMRDGLYDLNNSRLMDSLTQPMDFSNGKFSPGTANFKIGK